MKIVKLLENKRILSYYLMYAAKGAGFYITIFSLNYINNSEMSGEFFSFYSLLLVLIPLISMGVPNYLIRYSHLKVTREVALSVFTKFYCYIFLIGIALYFSFHNTIYLFIVFLISRVVSTIYEASAVSLGRYFRLSFSYFLQSTGYVITGLLLISKYVEDLDTLFFLLIIIDLFPFAFLLSELSISRYKKIQWSSVAIRATLSYGFKVVFLGFSLGLFINIDKLILGWRGFQNELADYAFLFTVVFSIHRFITTPMVMQISRGYFSQRDLAYLPDKVVWRGLGAIVTLSLLISLVLSQWYTFTNTSLNYQLLAVFFYFIAGLYLISLGLLYFKRELIVEKGFLLIGSTALLFSFVMWYLLDNLGYEIYKLSVVALSFTGVLCISFFQKAVRSYFFIAYLLFGLILFWTI